MELLNRPRRLRANLVIRSLVRETRVSKDALVYPLFVREGTDIVEEIPSMDGQYRYSPDRLDGILTQLIGAGVHSVLLFGIPATKDPRGSGAYQCHNRRLHV